MSYPKGPFWSVQQQLFGAILCINDSLSYRSVAVDGSVDVIPLQTICLSLAWLDARRDKPNTLIVEFMQHDGSSETPQFVSLHLCELGGKGEVCS
jgi:hypothetical protein